MELKDIFVTPFYLVIIYAVAYSIRARIKDSILRKKFIPALSMKLFGGVALGLVYQFYYGGGDTFNFFRDSAIIWDTFTQDPIAAIRIIFSPIENYSPDLYQYTYRIYFFTAGDAQTYHAIRVSAFFGFFTFHTYTVVAMCFAMLAFSGLWAVYKVFYRLFPKIHKPLEIAIFYIPSVIFWGSGILKDTITMAALGWLFYSLYFALIERRKIIRNLMLAFVMLTIIQAIKIYILMSFLPGVLFWLFLRYRNNVRNKALRGILLPVVIVVSIPLALLSVGYITADQERYKLENIAKTQQVTADWLETVSQREGGAIYSLGKWDGSLGASLRIAPSAIWLGLFQPHPWQAGFNPVRLLAALEASLFLLLTVKLIFSVGFVKIYRIVLENPVLSLCFIFSLILAFGVAITSSNYGNVVRYRIPFQPFFLAMLYIIRYKAKGTLKLF